MKKVFAVMLAIAGLGQLSAAAYIPAKAELAQVLLERAWRGSENKADRVRPWPWADTWPVARLRSIKHDVDLIVLEGMTGSTMAFGPAHMSASVLPGTRGNSVIGAHRDTHFDFLETVRIGDRLLVERNDGQEFWFRVSSIDVADSRNGQIPLDVDDSWLTLVTCYPFNAINPAGPLRYVVSARLISDSRAAAVHAP